MLLHEVLSILNKYNKGVRKLKIITFSTKKWSWKNDTCHNIASYMKTKYNKKILFLDADPQSNSTQMMVSDEDREKIYMENSEFSTILDFISPILIGDSTVDFTQKPFSSQNTRFEVDIILGHPSLSLFEDTLSDSWNSCKGRDVGGFRRTNWLLQFKKIYEDSYDFMIVDVGPSLGALNRSVLLNSDFFISPMGCDMFSLMGIENIARWIKNWERLI